MFVYVSDVMEYIMVSKGFFSLFFFLALEQFIGNIEMNNGKGPFWGKVYKLDR